ncbi:MAG: DNA topoisomerase IV subunit A [Methylococcaceae bacterium TMED69]|nr:MAG: DNA topoisomerase IV subunit A [Methylococcaceae bacterium TMED69]
MNKNHRSSDESIQLAEFAEKAYLEYSMYVILDRALPNICDGLKPVQRRIIFAMSELGLNSSSKFKKSARTVGDVIGKYHPHGDGACYEAMVLMAQDFSFNYKFIEGQGNWGSIDNPKSFAAMRYTEAKLTSYAESLLDELKFKTVDWCPNFDGTLIEPTILPAKVPNILINGSSGIAVGMATDIPSHNLNEVIKATILLIEKPTSSLEELMRIVIAPDFPTGGLIVNSREELESIYKNGIGSIRLRACFAIKKKEIVINELPYQVSTSKIMEQIASQIEQKKINFIDDIRDESDHESPVKIVLSLKGTKFDPTIITEHFCATTDLEKTIRVNFNLIGIDGNPGRKNIKQIIQEWIKFRTSKIEKKFKFQKSEVENRIHVLDGYLVAVLNIETIIAIIRSSEDPNREIQKKFLLSEAQTKSILELRLKQIAKLEEEKVKKERDVLQERLNDINKVLKSKNSIKKQIKKELEEERTSFGKERASRLVEMPVSKEINFNELIGPEPISVVLSADAWVKVLKGHKINLEKISFRQGDSLLNVLEVSTRDEIIFFDERGRAYCIESHKLSIKRGLGEPLASKFNPPDDTRFVGMACQSLNDYILFCSTSGRGFVAKTKTISSKTKGGKNTLVLDSGERLLFPIAFNDPRQEWVAIVSTIGKLLIFPANELPILTKGKGVKLMQLNANSEIKEEIAFITILKNEQSLRIYSGSKRPLILRESDQVSFCANRARRGQFLPKGFRKVTKFESSK